MACFGQSRQGFSVIAGWKPYLAGGKSKFKYAPLYIFHNYERFRVRPEFRLTFNVQTSDFSTTKRFRPRVGQARVMMPLHFVDAVDFSPSVTAPINYVTGACQRIGRNLKALRDHNTRYFNGQVVVPGRISKRGLKYLDTMNRRFADFERHYQARYDSMFPVTLLPRYSLEDWLDHSSYSASRKLQLIKAIDHPRLSYKVDSFIKKEAYPEVKPPRLINSREDAFKVLVGPFTHAIEKDVFSSRYTIKGKDSKTQTRIIYNRLRHKVFFLSTDYSRWESSVTDNFISKLERFVWNKYPSPYPWDFHDWLTNNTLNNRLCARKIFGGTVVGTRMSGDMHTSLMNTVINVLITDYIMSVLGITWDGFFEGDDGLIGLDSVPTPAQIQSISLLANELGFDLTMETSLQLKDATFLGRHIISDSATMREPCKAICHAQWSYSLTRHDPLEIVRSRGYGLIQENPHCPILYSLGKAFLRFAGDGPISHIDQWYRDFYDIPWYVRDVDVSAVPTDDTRREFERLFGVPYSTQVYIEHLLDTNQFELVKLHLTELISRNHPTWVSNYYLSTDFIRAFHYFDSSDR